MTDGIRTLVSGAVSDAIFSADGNTIYAAQGGTITAFSVATGAQVGSWTVGTKLGGMDLLPDGSGLVVTERMPGQTTLPIGIVVATSTAYSLSFGSGTVTTYTTSGPAAGGDGFFDVGVLTNSKAIVSLNRTDGAAYILDLAARTFTPASNVSGGQGLITDGTTPTHILITSNPFGTQYADVVDADGNYTRSSFTDGYYTRASAQAAVAGGNRMAMSGLTGLKILDGSGQLVADQTVTARAAVLDGTGIAGYEQYTTFQGLAYDVGGAHLYAYAAALHAVFEFNTADWTLTHIFATGLQPDGQVPNYGNRLQLSSDGHTLSVLTGGGLQLISTDASTAIVGSSQADRLLGTPGADVLYGHDGNDIIDGGVGADTMVGGAGDDIYYVDDSGDIVIDASGTDTIVTSIAYQPPAEIEIVRLAEGSTAQLSANTYVGTTLYGNALGNVLVGQNGNDGLYGGDGDDILYGFNGDDVLMGGAGDDRLSGEAGTNFLDGGDGADTAVYAGSSKSFTVTTLPNGDIRVTGVGIDDTLHSVEKIQFSDRTLFGDMATLASEIDAQYLTYAGRHATTSEIDAWSASLNNGSSTAAMRLAIIGALGQVYIDDQINQIYQTYGGRAPNGNEIAAWQSVLRANGYDFSAVRTAILKDPLGKDYTTAAVTAIYQSLAGRLPTPGEIDQTYKFLLNYGGSYTAVRSSVLAEAATHAFEIQQISNAYQIFGGRAPTSDELIAWHNALVAGSADYGMVRTAVLNSPLGHFYLDPLINQTYQTYGGRVATAGELTAWQSVLNGSTDARIVRDAILNSSLGKTYTDGQIDTAYQTYAGRHASAGELTAWENLLNTNNHTFAVVRDAILNSSLGTAYTDGQIGQIYQTYAGRAAGAGEISAWETVLNTNNHDFNAVKAAILNDPVASTYANTQIDTLYQRYFGRTASAGEEAAWRGVFQAGATFDALRDALMSSPGSATTTQQLTGTATADTFHLPTSPNNIVITGFDPAHDVIDLQGRGYGSINPLDTSHAHQIVTLDGATDVLISLDPTHDILLHNVQMSELSNSDFLL